MTIDDDVLRAARLFAHAHGVSLGDALSELARRGIEPPTGGEAIRHGVRLLPVNEAATGATLDEVNRLRDEVA
ncbi:hypothetical protein [Microbacterium sp.]|uniref:hypothetical protein n=1 Tax=Microbacterium sp. TaxID=51671 RepID=UPI003A8DA6B9